MSDGGNNQPSTPPLRVSKKTWQQLSSCPKLAATSPSTTPSSSTPSVLTPRCSPRARLQVAGGGASVIYADTIADLGLASELGCYGEYSGGPNSAETYSYASVRDLSCSYTHVAVETSQNNIFDHAPGK